MSDYLDTGNTRLLEDSVAETRSLADGLAFHAASFRTAPATPGLLDEIVRCSHSLHAEAVAAGMQGLGGLAQLVRDTAEAVRSAEDGSHAAAGTLLHEAAQAAVRLSRGEQVDVDALRSLLAKARDAAGMPPSTPARHAVFHVSSLRIDEAVRVAAQAERAAEALAQGLQGPLQALGEAREGLASCRDALAAIEAGISASLESVRIGMAPSEASREMCARLAPAGKLLLAVEEKVEAAARAFSEAGAQGARAARETQERVCALRLVPLSRVFKGAARAAGFARQVEVHQDGIELDWTAVPILRKALAPLLDCRVPNKKRAGRRDAPLSLSAEEKGGFICVTVSGGTLSSAARRKQALAKAQDALAAWGGTAREGKGVEVCIPRTPGKLPCLLVRSSAGAEVCALPAQAIVECITVSWPSSQIRRGEREIPVLGLEALLMPTAPRSHAARSARVGVIVRSGRRMAALAVDVQEGLQTIEIRGPWSPRASSAGKEGLRADGTAIRVLDARFLVARACARVG